MESVFWGQVPKDPEFPGDIEDAPILGIVDNRIVLSDGASESFDSKTWARLLSESASKYREPLSEMVPKVIGEYTACFDISALTWSKQAAFARGSFATLLVVDYLPESSSVRIFSVGDSLAVLLDKDKLIQSYPYQASVEFEQHPELISTRTALNNFLLAEEFYDLHQAIWPLSDLAEPIVLCMTDALGQWALQHEEAGTPVWQELCGITEVSQLVELVLRERQAKAMRWDDTTFVRLSFIERQGDVLSDT